MLHYDDIAMKEDQMPVETHLDALRRKHASLSEQVETTARQPGADSLEIAQLKKEKLALKEQIGRLQA